MTPRLVLSSGLLALALGQAGCAPNGSQELGSQTQELRPNTPGGTDPPPAFDPTETVERYVSASRQVVVHFTRAGRNQVPADDTDRDGIPDFVNLVATTYDEVRNDYAMQLGLRSPLTDQSVPVDNGGGPEFDVYLVDFAGRADGAFRRENCLSANPQQCTGYMLQENDFAGYRYPTVREAIRTVASHEFFHAVQAAYYSTLPSVPSESTAVWATEHFDPALTDLESLSAAYLRATDRQLDAEPTSPGDSYAYGVSLFFEFLSEHVSPRAVPDFLIRLGDLRADENATAWLPLIDEVLQRNHSTTFSAEFLTFAEWNLRTGTFATAGVGYRNAAGLQRPATPRLVLPSSMDRIRMFRASARYWSVQPDGRPMLQLRALLDPTETRINGVRLLAIPRNGTTLGTAVWSDAGSLTLTLNTASTLELLIGVVNPLFEGGSVQPALCVGSPAEVDACAATIRPPMNTDVGETDAATDAAVETDVATTDVGGEPPAMRGGCACDTRSQATPPAQTGLLALTAMLALLRKRRATDSA